MRDCMLLGNSLMPIGRPISLVLALPKQACFLDDILLLTFRLSRYFHWIPREKLVILHVWFDHRRSSIDCVSLPPSSHWQLPFPLATCHSHWQVPFVLAIANRHWQLPSIGSCHCLSLVVAIPIGSCHCHWQLVLVRFSGISGFSRNSVCQACFSQ